MRRKMLLGSLGLLVVLIAIASVLWPDLMWGAGARITPDNYNRIKPDAGGIHSRMAWRLFDWPGGGIRWRPSVGARKRSRFGRYLDVGRVLRCCLLRC
jgi:hypothetical protein